MSKLANFAAVLQTYGPWGIFAIALIDSMGIPLPAVDLFLVAIGVDSVRHPSRAYFAAAMAIVGSLIGNAILYQTIHRGRDAFIKNNGDAGKYQLWFQRYGLLTVFVPAVTPFIPLPLKVFVISAAAFRTPFATFMTVIAAARVIRYFGVAWLALQLGADARGFLTRNCWTIAGVAIGVAHLLYLAMRWSGRHRAA
jgi:membrane protein YqaA with SNARE-associated domain